MIVLSSPIQIFMKKTSLKVFIFHLFKKGESKLSGEYWFVQSREEFGVYNYCELIPTEVIYKYLSADIILF